MMKYDDFKLLRGFDNGQTDRQTDISDCRVIFLAESSNQIIKYLFVKSQGLLCLQMTTCSCKVHHINVSFSFKTQGFKWKVQFVRGNNKYST